MKLPATFLALLALGGCASQPTARPGQAEPVSRAMEQPMRDLSLIRDQAPPVLQRAMVAPYEREDLKTCGELAQGITELDAALGPDLEPGAKSGDGLSASGLAADLVGGAIGLPFRGVVRHVTGAERRERALRAATLAGMVRRGFLKGRLAEMSCEAPHAAPVASSAP